MRRPSSLWKRLAILAGPLLAALLVNRPAAVNAQIVINGGAVVLTDGVNDGLVRKPEPDPAGPHLIEFFDGRQLHGTIETLDLTHHEITWRRPDADQPLVISTFDISRLSFDPASQEALNPVAIQFGIPNAQGAPDAAENKGLATVKFTGGDWLVAEVHNILDTKIHLELSDHSALEVDRGQVEWVYFPKGAAPECYEGPTSMAGWVSGGGWAYRDGSLRATTPTQIGRNLGSLPDQVEYQFEVDQGNLLSAFTVNLHGRYGLARGGSPAMVQCMLRANTLNVYGNVGGNFKSRQVDLTQILGTALDGREKAGKTNPVLFQAFEDFTGGKLLIYLNHQKAGEWELQKGDSGRNGGGISFQPTVWNSNSEQTLSKIRIMPWDGRLPDDPAAAASENTDHLLLADGTTHDGKFVDLAAGTIRMRAEGSTTETARDQVRMLRFHHQNAQADPAPTIAHLRLTQGGEFDASAVDWRNGKLEVHTRIGTQIVLPVSAVADLHLAQTPPALAVAQDVLVFKNGDRIKGHLVTAAENEKLHWRMGESEKPVEFAPKQILGVRRDGDDGATHKRVDCVVRFRNDDWLAGQFVTLDKTNLVLDTADAGQITVARPLVRTLYFSRDGTLPISDGAADDREWLRGLDLTPTNTMRATPKVNPANIWRSFDGAFSVGPLDAQSGVSRAGGIHIGRHMDGLPALIQVSFDVTGSREQILFAAQLFSDPSNPGYFMQFHSQGMYIYDLNPAQRGRGIVPQQVQFEGKLKSEANHRHLDLYANRDTGMLAIFVDGVLITRFGGKAGTTARQLGHGLMLSPQVGMPSTFSNLWFGPWNGRLPGQTAGTEATPDTAILNNGDEAQGTVELATPSNLKLASDVGPLDLPMDRLTMVDFGGAAPARTAGARVHLAEAGVLTINGYRVEKDAVKCRSEVAGELNLPLGAVRELVFAQPAQPSAPTEREQADRPQGQLLQRGNGFFQIVPQGGLLNIPPLPPPVPPAPRQ